MKRINFKENIKGIIFLTAFVASANLIFAENKDGIYLPDITTVVEDNSEALIPEIPMILSSVIELPEGTISDQVILAVVEEPVVEPEVLPEPEPKHEYNIEGTLGGGFPVSFKGSLFLSSADENNPFNLDVLYDSHTNYAGHLQFEGFYDRLFSVKGEKDFHSEDGKNTWHIDGAFRDTENGLQGLSDSAFYNMTDAAGKFSWTRVLPKGFEFKTGLEADLYNRSVESLSDNLFAELSPELQFGWYYKDFQAFLKGNYNFEYGLGTAVHRGYTGFEAAWQNSNVKLLGNVGAVFGNKIGNQNILVPFTVGTTVHFPVKFSEKEVVISAEGGMSSKFNKASSLEQNNLFSALSADPEGIAVNNREVSDWYGIVKFNLPVKSFMGLNVNVEYRKTAFDNGFIQADYSDLPAKGLYGFDSYNRQLIHSEENILFSMKNFDISFGWKSNFDFVPYSENEQLISTKIGYNADMWDACGKLEIPLISADSTPILGFESSVKLNSALRIAITLEDTVKLIQGQTRISVGQYASRSGRAGLLVKFNY